jgi:hypothetical protein
MLTEGCSVIGVASTRVNVRSIKHRWASPVSPVHGALFCSPAISSPDGQWQERTE